MVMMEAAGFPDKKGALTQVSKATGVPHPTLSRWWHKLRNPVPEDLVQKKRYELQDLLEREIRNALLEMVYARSDASYKDLATAIGIMIDKKQLVEGKATERVEHGLITPEERRARVIELLDTARDRRTG